MEEKTKVRITVAVTSLIGIAYFFLCAVPLPRQLVLKPRWDNAVPDSFPYAAGNSASTEPLHSFQIGERYGFFDGNSGLSFAATRGYGASVSDAGYVSWEMKPGSLQFKDPRGVVLFTAPATGYPFMDGARRFVIAANQERISEYDASGAMLWERDFPSLVTAFASNAGIAVIGTMDGRIFGIDKSGKEVLSFAPGGSRIDCVYGLAVSPDGKNIAATAGLDRQRVLVLEKREEAYRVTWHRWTDSDFRRPVSMAFTPDGRELVFETSGGLGVYDAASRRERVISMQDPVVSSMAITGRDMLLALEQGGKPSLMAASYGGIGYFRFPLVAEDSTLISDGNSIFLGLVKADSTSLLRLDFVEE